MFRRTSGGLQPGYFDVEWDFCEMMKPNSTTNQLLRSLMTNFSPGYLEQIEKFWFSCPVAQKWQIEYNSYGDKTKHGNSILFSPVVFAVVPPGEYRFVVRVYNKTNQTAYEMNYNWFYNN
jgi:hypothetical protein